MSPRAYSVINDALVALGIAICIVTFINVIHAHFAGSDEGKINPIRTHPITEADLK
jgi:hypothetical protein